MSNRATRLADFLTYSAMTGMMFQLLKPRRRDSEILRVKIDLRLAELRAEELRLVATRAYIVGLWGEPDSDLGAPKST